MLYILVLFLMWVGVFVLFFTPLMSHAVMCFGTTPWSINILLDNASLSMLLMLLICFGFVYKYTPHYFGGGSDGVILNYLICLFVAVMGSLVVSGDVISTLVFWEYLGVVSFFLILFYLKYLSVRSSIMTLVSSRFGDVCVFVLISIVMTGGSAPWVGLLLFILMVGTKSAMFPLTSWLLEAMRAPTPVSALVHSSTLVAAGVWFSMRYDGFEYINNSVLILGLLLMTIFMTGLSCYFFFDLKKIVALSTCNNISWCLLYLLVGDPMLSLFQLISHGVSKCLLFILAGDVMSGSAGSQASNGVYSTLNYGPYKIFSLFCVVLGLSGAPFIGVFFTKHLLMSSLSGVENPIFVVSCLFCVFLSYFYSFRFCVLLKSKFSSIKAGVFFCFGSGVMVYMWLFVNYIMSNFMSEFSVVPLGTSVYLIFCQVASGVSAVGVVCGLGVSYWCSHLFGCDKFVDLWYRAVASVHYNVSLFMYRWDSTVLCMFHPSGFTMNWGMMLNMVVAGLLFLLLCLNTMCLISMSNMPFFQNGDLKIS